MRILCGIVPAIIFLSMLADGCTPTPKSQSRLSRKDSIRIVEEVLNHRKEVDDDFRNNPDSPFNLDSSIRFDGIKWFPPDVNFHFLSRLFRYQTPETVTVYGTKGEPRKQLRFGYFELPLNGNLLRMNVYKFTPSDSTRYRLYKDNLSVWFTDATTGKETYNVGRYIDVGDQKDDPMYLYVIDFNNAYNPYCAYSARYSCAIPPKEDHFDFPIRAGEMKYHE